MFRGTIPIFGNVRDNFIILEKFENNFHLWKCSKVIFIFGNLRELIRFLEMFGNNCHIWVWYTTLEP